MYDKNENYAYFTSVCKNNKPKLLWYLYADYFLGIFLQREKVENTPYVEAVLVCLGHCIGD